MTWKIPLFKIYGDEEDTKAVTEAIKWGMNWAVGSNTEKFEKMKKIIKNEAQMNNFNHSTTQPLNNLASQPLNHSTPDDVAIRVDHVSKKFCRYLRKSMLYGIQDISRNLLGMSTKPDTLRKHEFWAVNDVSFE